MSTNIWVFIFILKVQKQIPNTAIIINKYLEWSETYYIKRKDFIPVVFRLGS